MDLTKKEIDFINNLISNHWVYNNTEHKDNKEDFELTLELVKKLTIPVVSNRRELLIDFFRKTSNVQADDKGNMWLVEKCVDEYLKDN